MDNSKIEARNFFKRIFWPILWTYQGFVFFWLLLFLFSGDNFRIVRLIAYFKPWLLILLVPTGLVAIIGKRKYLALVFFCLSVVLGIPYAQLFLPRWSPSPRPVGELRVMSYSINGWNWDLGAIVGVIRQERPDILLEQGVPRAEELPGRLHGLYPQDAIHSLLQPGFGVISRYPLTQLRSIAGAQKVRVELPSGPVAIWNVHTSKDPHGYLEQVRQVRGIVADVQATAGPKIVAGDFNTTEGSVPYRMLAEALENAHEEAGIGFGFTYPGPGRRLGRLMPFLRIDHIFYSDDFYALAAGTLGDAGGSDHFPVWARLGKRQAGKRAG